MITALFTLWMKIMPTIIKVITLHTTLMNLKTVESMCSIKTERLNIVNLVVKSPYTKRAIGPENSIHHSVS